MCTVFVYIYKTCYCSIGVLSSPPTIYTYNKTNNLYSSTICIFLFFFSFLYKKQLQHFPFTWYLILPITIPTTTTKTHYYYYKNVLPKWWWWCRTHQNIYIKKNINIKHLSHIHISKYRQYYHLSISIRLSGIHTVYECMLHTIKPLIRILCTLYIMCA